MKHHIQSSPGSKDLMIGWLVAWKCWVACYSYSCVSGFQTFQVLETWKVYKVARY